MIAAAFAGDQVAYPVRGAWTAQLTLPLQLTDAVTLASIAALLRPDATIHVELVYFWTFSATL